MIPVQDESVKPFCFRQSKRDDVTVFKCFCCRAQIDHNVPVSAERVMNQCR